ncbi:sulfite exporter TauE/SafE family protein [Tessaracoccus antarcticus]|nr:sulfite exporter TauE/SafE family protein [Tessaracoccus antarcticus]
MGVLEMVLVAMVVLTGAATQRVSGMGFGLVSAPLLVLIMGPFLGILLTNTLGLTTSLIVLTQVWRQVELRKLALLAPPALLAIIPGAWVALNVPSAPLAIVVGSMTFSALLGMLLSERLRVFHGTTGAVAAGALSGFMSVTAGAGGPAITLYALSTRWKHRSFVGTAQLCFAIITAASLTAKGGPPDLPAATWALTLGALLMGVLLGGRVARYIPATLARALMVGLALTGSLTTVAKGIIDL